MFAMGKNIAGGRVMVNNWPGLARENLESGQDLKVTIDYRDILYEIVQKRLGNTSMDFVFPGWTSAQTLSNMAFLMTLRRMGRAVTAHGFRSTFRDWAAEETDFPNFVVEKALAHTIENKVEAAYRRGDLLKKRRELMEAWANFCEAGPSKVTTENARLEPRLQFGGDSNDDF